MNIDRLGINMDATTLIISVYSMHEHARGRSTTDRTNSGYCICVSSKQPSLYGLAFNNGYVGIFLETSRRDTI